MFCLSNVRRSKVKQEVINSNITVYFLIETKVLQALRYTLCTSMRVRACARVCVYGSLFALSISILYLAILRTDTIQALKDLIIQFLQSSWCRFQTGSISYIKLASVSHKRHEDEFCGLSQLLQFTNHQVKTFTEIIKF